jgi:hypothetical protein
MNPESVRLAVARWREEGAGSAAEANLMERLQQEPAALEAVVEELAFDRDVALAVREVVQPGLAAAVRQRRQVSPRRAQKRSWWKVAVAASSAATIALLTLWWTLPRTAPADSTPPSVATSPSPSATAPSAPAAATPTDPLVVESGTVTRVGNTWETGATGAILNGPHGVVVAMAKESRLRTGIDAALLDLRQGEVEVRAPHQAADKALHFRARDLSVTIIGTRFTLTADRDADRSSVQVAEGVVEARIDGRPEVRRLGPGMGWSTAEAQTNLRPQVPSLLPPGQWQLTFAEEFSGPILDPTRWNATGVVDNDYELQRYRAENLEFAQGVLKVWARQEDDAGQVFTSGKITTENKFWQRFGYIEARMKLPRAPGLQPGAGALIHPFEGRWPPAVYFQQAWPTELGWSNFYASIPYGPNHPEPGGGFAGQDIVRQPLAVDVCADFHAYGWLWSPTTSRFFFDGVVIGESTQFNPVSHPMWFHFQTAILAGGQRPRLNAALELDHVRIYQEVSSQRAVPPIFEPEAGDHDGPLSVRVLGSSLEQIRYTVDGSEPTATHGLVYAQPIRLERTTTLRAIIIHPGVNPSPVVGGTYVINGSKPPF